MPLARPTIFRTRMSLVTFVAILASSLVWTLTGAGPAYALAGDLDPTFDGDGVVVTSILPPEVGRGVALLPDGRLAVVGTGVTGTSTDFEVALYLTSGALDTRFSGDGKATINIQTYDFAEAVDIMIENGLPKIIIAGCTSNALDSSGSNCGPNSQMAVAKVDPASSAAVPLDPSFGTAGIAQTTTLLDGVGHDVVVQPNDNKIIVAGATTSPVTGRDFALARFDSNGSLDTTWGTAGIATTNNSLANKDDEAWAVNLQYTDPAIFKVVAAGQSDDSIAISPENLSIAVARYTNLGAQDPQFSDDGFTTTDISGGSADIGRDVKIQPSSDGSLPGRIVVGGHTLIAGQPEQFAVVRYLDSGPEDPSFDEDGKQIVDVPLNGPSGQSHARAIDFEPNRKIVLTGFSKFSSGTDSEFAVVRLTPDGALDPLFSGDGKLTTSLANNTSDGAWDAVIQPDGKIVAAGVAGTNLGVARYFGDPVAYLTPPPLTAEGNSGKAPFNFTVTLSAATSQTLNLRFFTLTTGTATGCVATSTDTACDFEAVDTLISFPAGTTSKTVPVQVRGDTVPEQDETIVASLAVTTTSSPASVNPARSIATATVVNDDAPSLTIDDVERAEGVSGTVQDFRFKITQSIPNGPGTTTTVQFQTADSTATVADNDYELRSGTALIPPNASSIEVAVPVNGDDTKEPNEAFFVNLSTPGCTPSPCLPPVIADGQGVGMILDDDSGPQLSISDVSDFEGNFPDTKLFNFLVTKAGITTETVTATFKTDDCQTGPCDGSTVSATVAQGGVDYESRSGTLVFAPGPTQTQTVTVTVNGDDAGELNEIFKVTITSIKAEVQKGEGRGTILDDDRGGGDGGGEIFTESLGGALIGSPDAASWAENRLDVFAIGTDNALWQKSMAGDTWTGWGSLGGRFTSDPAAVSWDTDRIDVFGRGGDNAIWHASYSGGSWSGWESLGGAFTSGPDVASWAPGRLDVFGKGGDNALWRKSWNGTSWSAWESLGGVITSDPSAASWGPNRIDVFAKGGDNALWQKSWDGTSWSGWGSLGGLLIGGPDASSKAENRLDVFVIGTDKALWQNSGTGGSWTGWGSWGGIFTSDPSAVSWGPNRIDAFGRGGDNALWHKWQGGSP